MPSQSIDPRALKAAAEQMDWQQVIHNGGPPCFHLIDGKFCGRAQRWVGHKVLARARVADHDFVPLSAIIQSHFAESVNGKLLEDIEHWKIRHAAAQSETQNVIKSVELILASAPLSIEQRSELADYATHYLDRGVHGCWHDLATGIRALLSHVDKLEKLAQSKPPSMADQLAEALRAEMDIHIHDVNCQCPHHQLLARYDAQKGQS